MEIVNRIIGSLLFFEIFSISGVHCLFFIGLAFIILDIKYKNKSSSNLSEDNNKKRKLKKFIDFLIIFFTLILIYMVIRFIYLFLFYIFSPALLKGVYAH